MGAWEDMGRTILPALERGTLGLLNTGGAVASGVRNAAGWMMGFTPEQLQAMAEAQNAFGIGVPRSTSTVIDKAEDVQGPLHQPQTWQGDLTDRFVSNIPAAALGPGGLVTKGLSAGGSALGGFTGREGTGYLLDQAADYAPAYRDTIEGYRPYVEGVADFAGNVGGSFMPNIARSVITPNPMTADRAANVRTLEDHGVEMTAGQRTGNQNLHAAEAQTGGTGYWNIRERQNRQYTAGALEQGGIPPHNGVRPDVASPEVLNRQHAALGAEFDRLQAIGMQPDSQFFSDLVQLRDNYRATMPQHNRAPIIETTVRQLADRAQRGIPVDGELLRTIGTQLRRTRQAFRASGRADDAEAIDNLIETIDNGLERSLAQTHPNEVGRFRQIREQYRNLITVEEAASRAPDGQLSPADLTSATKKMETRRGYSRGFGPFNGYSRAGAEILRDPPNSGTTSRLMAALGGAGRGVASIPAATGGMIGFGLGGPVGAGVGTAVGSGLDMAIRAGRNYLRMTPIMQRYLGNQAAAGWTPAVGAGIRAGTIGAANSGSISDLFGGPR
jgi:hypothetical protein